MALQGEGQAFRDDIFIFEMQFLSTNKTDSTKEGKIIKQTKGEGEK